MDLEELICRLCAASGPSGSEEGARAAAAELLRPYVDELQTDALGNLIALRRCGLPGAPRILLDAHLDEVGLIVTGCERGFLRFASLGGVDARMLPAREVVVLTEEPMRGVIDTLPVHSSPPRRWKRPSRWKSFASTWVSRRKRAMRACRPARPWFLPAAARS